jgi:hypothetical protein
MQARDDRCALTELFVDQCAHCRGERDIDPLEGLLIERFRIAQYDGHCALVEGHAIEAGTTIGLAVSEDGGGITAGMGLCQVR